MTSDEFPAAPRRVLVTGPGRPLWNIPDDVGHTLDGAEDLLAKLREVREKQRWLAAYRTNPPKLRTAAAAVDAAYGLTVARPPVRLTCDVRSYAEIRLFENPSPSTQPVANLEYWRQRIAEHHETAVRADELVRLQARDEYEAGRRATQQLLAAASRPQSAAPAAVTPAKNPSPRHIPEKQRNDAMAIEIATVLANLPRGIHTGPREVMAALQARAGKSDSCIVDSAVERVIWRSGTGVRSPMNLRALRGRLQRLKSTD